MIVLDTHAVVFWRGRDRRLSRAARAAMEADEVFVVPSVVLWEIGLLAETGRIRLDRAVGPWLRALTDDPRVEVGGITPTIVVRALDVRRHFGGGDPVDHLVAATALALDAPLVSADARLAEFPELRVVW